MLKLMRNSFQHLKWILVAIVAIFIIFIFVDWGAGGAGGRTTNDVGYAARVNGDTISFREYDRALYYAEENYKRMYGAQFTPEMAEAMGLNRQVLDSLIDQRLILQQAVGLHLSATPEELRRKILQIPVLSPGGKFVGADLYEQYVRQLGFSSTADFEDEIARDITMQKMESALASSVVVSPKAAEEEYRRNSESAKVRYAFYSGARELANVTVAPAEMESYYKANQTKYSHGEQRNFMYLVADLARIRSQITAPEAQIRQRYEASKETDFKRPEQAHILHILIKVDPAAPAAADAAARAKAESLVKQIRGGADFAALAKVNSQDPSSSSNGGDMGFVNKGDTVEPFDTAAFSIPLNTISDPIRSKEFGYHIIKVLERRPPGYRPFEEVREAISNQIVSQMATDQARDEITRVSARIKEKKPASSQEFTALANDRVSSNKTDWFGKGDAIPGLGANEPLAAWAFTAKIGDVSDVVGTRRGPAIAYVDNIRPAGISPLADVRARVEADEKTEKARQVALQKVTDAVNGAPNIDAVATKLGITAQDTTVTRNGMVAGITGDTSGFVDGAMKAQPGQLSRPVVAGDGAVAFVVSEQKKLTPQELKTNVAQYVDVIRQRDSRALRASLLQRLKKQAKVDINPQTLKQSRSTGQGA
jgi:peptidyl-prolyl cis-trans isomerase D